MIVMIQNAEIYMFDEPTSYLDVKQRIKMAKLVRATQTLNNYIIVVEHDLSILDYLSDFICCLYGEPAAYGVVTMPFTVREGINIFLAGYIPTENMRFREEELTFKISDAIEEMKEDKVGWFDYPKMVKTQGDFTLTVNPGRFKTSQITVMLGENGTGKTTFIKMLAECGKKPKEGKEMKEVAEELQYNLPNITVSYKPQTIAPKFEGTVRELLNTKVKDSWMTPNFIAEVTRPLNLENIIDNEVQQLSGGELQRVAIILALAKGAMCYLIDEPSAYLDSEQRVICARVLKRFIINNQKSAFIVEHDFIMATYLADQVIVYEGEPGVNCVANAPQGLIEGMNKFLNMLEITFRRDPTNFRPRINKLNSVLDKEQKTSGNYFCADE